MKKDATLYILKTFSRPEIGQLAVNKDNVFNIPHNEEDCEKSMIYFKNQKVIPLVVVDIDKIKPGETFITTITTKGILFHKIFTCKKFDKKNQTITFELKDSTCLLQVKECKRIVMEYKDIHQIVNGQIKSGDIVML